MLRFAVVGYPVSHSKSPLIHSMFARQTGKLLEYSLAEVESEKFENYVTNFFKEGGAGLNVTVPYKERAYLLVKHSTERASLAGAVNTLYLDQAGTLCGDNTDGPGLVNDLKKNHGVAIRGKSILILGAGGAVRGALSGLVTERPGNITLLNRTESKARQLQKEFGDLLSIKIGSYDDEITEQFDLIINGTSMGLQDETPPISPAFIGKECCCYDMMYGNQDTAFVSWAKTHGAQLSLDGLGMLVEQAAESFKIWCEIRPETTEVIRQLKQDMKQ